MFLNNLDPGLKIAGVTGQGVIASSWFRLRGNPKFFTLSNLLLVFAKDSKERFYQSWDVFSQHY